MHAYMDRRMKRNPRPVRYTSRAQYDSASVSPKVLAHEIARQVARKRESEGDKEEEDAVSADRKSNVDDFEMVNLEDASSMEDDAVAERAATETPLASFECEMVTAAAVCAGTLQVSNGWIAFVPDRNGAAAGHRDEGGKLERIRAKGRKVWQMASLREMHGRRYLLRSSALELFFDAGRTSFFNFPKTCVVKDAYARLLALCGRKNLRRCYLFDVNKEMLRVALTEDWVNRKITNFEYLMQLNTLAGRSYNDITQVLHYIYIYIYIYTYIHIHMTSV
jgi:hypothetical protein